MLHVIRGIAFPQFQERHNAASCSEMICIQLQRMRVFWHLLWVTRRPEPCVIEEEPSRVFAWQLYSIDESRLASVCSQRRSAQSLLSPEVLQLPLSRFLGPQCVSTHWGMGRFESEYLWDITHGSGFSRLDMVCPLRHGAGGVWNAVISTLSG